MAPAYFGCIPITNPGFAAVSGKTGRQVSRGGQWPALGVGGYTWGMDAILCLDSALEFYHISRMADRRPECVDPAARAVPLDLPRSKVKSLSGHTPTCEDARLLARSFGGVRLEGAFAGKNTKGLTLPIHLLVAKNVPRWQTDDRRQHYAAEPLPEGSFVRVEPGLLLSSPEHIVLQSASKLDALHLAWLASELCALYSIHPTIPGELLPAFPVTSRARLQAYLANAAEVGAYGAKKALAAMPYVLEGAASPRELSLALNMTLPRSMGGYALPKPLLNCRIDVDKRIRTAYGKDHFTVDACWVGQKLVVEYDSDAFHLDPKRRAHDNDRRAMLGEMGYRVLPISSKQQDALVLSDNAFRRLGKLLGVKDRSGESRYDWQARRSALRRTLRELETRRGGQTRSDGLEEWR
jgi:hypothetical protein